MKKKYYKIFQFALGPILSGLIMALVIPITTYFISPTEYGKASMFIIVQGFIASFIYLGFDQAFTREYHEYVNKKNLFLNSFFIPLVLSLIIFLFGILNISWISGIIFPGNEFRQLVVAFLIMIIFTVIERFLLMYLRMSEDGKNYSLFTILSKLLVLCITVMLLTWGVRDFRVVVWSTIWGQIIADVILIAKFKDLFNFNNLKWIDLKLLKRMLFFGLPVLIAVSMTSILQMIDRIFLREFSSYHELGVYTAGLKLVAIVVILQTILINVWVPVSYRWYSEKRKISDFQRVSDVVNLLLIVAILFMTIIGPILSLFLSKRYSEVQYYFPLMVMTVYFSCISETTNLGIVFSRKSYLNIVVTILSVLVDLILSFLLIPKFGARGAALSNTIAYFVFFLLRTYFSQKNGFKIKIRYHLFSAISLILLCSAKAFFNLDWSMSFLISIPIFTLIMVVVFKKKFFYWH